MRLVEALIMDAGYKAARFRGQAKTRTPKHRGRPMGRPLLAITFSTVVGDLDYRIPRRGDHAVSAGVFFDIAEARERVVEALHHQLVRDHHVVDPAA